MGRVTVEVELANNEDLILAHAGAISADKIRPATVSGIVDIGATRLVLPKSVADQLGLPVESRVGVRYADHR